ncbi:unnamed protein product [Spirodela intermedia]|uniref:Reverse transcriptase domain-containing protein n=1 Tax=Spirodela intermedia TaxID=51605 RepID=A0A7I8IFU4_SPIIN|nr:unnamed protein product [Spirodela intermedia]CAA6656579.1 unnamed protein product [Spirodela intermedia]CAA6675796.1 unnamed protein product [Spirodela intermedia]
MIPRAAPQDTHQDHYYDQGRYPSPPHCDFGGDHRVDRLDDRDKRCEDHRARILKSVRADVAVFDSSHEPKDFIDWESSMNSYFWWYRMDDDLCVEYVEMRLVPTPQLDTTAAREITLAPRTTMPTSSPTTDDSLHTSIFYTYVKINGHACKVIVDSGSCVNVLFYYDVQLMGRANTCSFMYRDRRLVWYMHTNKLVPKRDPKSRIGLICILSEYADVLLEELPRELPPLRHIQHAIDLVPRASLLNLPHYCMEPAKYKELSRQVQELLDKGFIQPSLSPCAMPALLAPTKDGTWRMCCDSHAINRIMVKYRFLILRLQDLFDMMIEVTIFSKIDLRNGYHQIRIRLGTSLYEWRVMPFGLSNVPNTFQRLMNEVLRLFIGKFIVVYFDNILGYSGTSIGEALCHSKKCSFFTFEVTFLSFVISERGVFADPEKVCTIVTWPQPGSMHDIRSFIRLAMFYRHFIWDFSSVTAPLIDCFKKETFLWTETTEQAFNRVKTFITQALILCLPVFGKVFEVACHPIEYFSKKLNDMRLRYSTYDREFYAVI